MEENERIDREIEEMLDDIEEEIGGFPVEENEEQNVYELLDKRAKEVLEELGDQERANQDTIKKIDILLRLMNEHEKAENQAREERIKEERSNLEKEKRAKEDERKEKEMKHRFRLELGKDVALGVLQVLLFVVAMKFERTGPINNRSYDLFNRFRRK